jgi:hypothetical protein
MIIPVLLLYLCPMPSLGCSVLQLFSARFYLIHSVVIFTCVDRNPVYSMSPGTAEIPGVGGVDMGTSSQGREPRLSEDLTP